MKRLKKLSKKIASKTFSSNSKSGASAVTKVYSERLNTLRSVEGIFYNLSNNFLEMAKAMDATTTTLEETKDSLKQQISEKQRFDEEASLEKKSNKEKLTSKVVAVGGDNSSSLFDQIAQSLQTIISVLSTASSSPDLPDVDKGKGKGKGKGTKAGKFKIPKALKVGGKILGGVGLAVGAYEASEYLKETGYGNRMAKGEGGRAEKAFREKNTDFSSQPLTADEAKSILDVNNPRDIEAYGGKERLEKIAGLQKPPIAATQYNYKDTSVGGGRTTMKDDPRRTDFVKAEVSNVVKSTFTPSQLKWLGDADPTDPVILSRMPPPEPGEVGGPPLEAPKPVVQVAKPKPEPVVKPAPPSAEVKPPPSAIPKVELPKAQGNGKFSTQKDFVNALSPYAEKVAQMIGGKVPSVAILGQWAGESKFGQAMPADFNYAGIKAGKQFQKGDFVLTEEFYTDAQLQKAKAAGESFERELKPGDKIKKGGRDEDAWDFYKGRGKGEAEYQKSLAEGKHLVQVKSYFAKFNNFDDFANSFAKFISSPRYAKAREETTPAGFGFEIAKAGYATASAKEYSAKIANFALSQGNNIGDMSTTVASAKKQQSGQTTYNINNSTSTAIKVGAPQGSSTTVARPVG